MIDAGADLVAGHGPHLLRGMELYKGKPIFYSLGNFLGQNELVAKIPADGYERFRADPELKPGQVYQQRTNNDQGGFPADRRYWESVVPVLTWEGRELRGIELVPISLGWKDAAPPPRPATAGRGRGGAGHPGTLRRAVEAVRHEFADEARSVRLG